MKQIFFYLAVGALCSTASIAAADCRTGNWYATGVLDGADGRAPNYIRSYSRECRRRGTRINTRDWQEGRKAGLASYCTTENARSYGQRGRGFAPFCETNERPLARAHERGVEVHRLNEEFEYNRKLFAQVLSQIQRLENRNPTEANRLKREKQRISDELTYIKKRLDELS
ncbi:DUF2799 domain-containing protein [Rhodobacteraceae bacterium]|nr:DUF2799 domain-containing protein [Paracoccaceae bacterium]